MSEDLLVRAVRTLAGVCDGARTWDGQGFNKFDADFGHRMAEVASENWTPKQRRAVWKMVKKYRVQLESSGILYDEIPEPPEVEKGSENGTGQFRPERILNETEKAFQFEIQTGDQSEETIDVWMPKSQVDYIGEAGEYPAGEWTAPVWLLKKRELI